LSNSLGIYDSNGTVSGSTSLNYTVTGTTKWTSVTVAISPYPQGAEASDITSINGIALASIQAMNGITVANAEKLNGITF
jgi:hypothetical protein